MFSSGIIVNWIKTISNREIIPYDGAMNVDTYHITIESLAFGGDGVGTIEAPQSSLNGIRCFVPFSAPGDVLSIRIRHRGKRFVRGELLSIEIPSPNRTNPRCPHFGSCGGCQWQHIDYTTQLKSKSEILRQNLARIATIDITPEEAIASPRVYGYRSRARLRSGENGRLGYHAASSHSVIAIDRCPVLTPDLEKRVIGGIESSTEFPHDTQFLFQETGGNGHQVQWERIGSGGDESIGFRQANEGVNHLLQDEIARFITQSEAKVLDLYCGDGNLSLPLARQGCRIRGFDIATSSIKQANRLWREGPADTHQVSYQRLDAIEAVKAIKRGAIRPFGTERPDVILLDPPRSGVGSEGMQALCTLKAQRILYLSCDPATLSRDLKTATAAGYHLLTVRAADMFPQTYHLESFAVLERR